MVLPDLVYNFGSDFLGFSNIVSIIDFGSFTVADLCSSFGPFWLDLGDENDASGCDMRSNRQVICS